MEKNAMTLERTLHEHPHWWSVKVLPEECQAIDSVGRERSGVSEARGWTTKTADRSGEWDLAGIRGEWAASQVLNLPISTRPTDSLEKLRSSDLSNWVEVKARRELDPRRWDLAVNEDQLKSDRVYVLTLTCFWPEAVIVCGWAWGYEIERGMGYTHQASGHRFRVLSNSKLKNVKMIFDLPEWRSEKGLTSVRSGPIEVEREVDREVRSGHSGSQGIRGTGGTHASVSEGVPW